MAGYGFRIDLRNENNERSWTEIFYATIAAAPGTDAFNAFWGTTADARVNSLVVSNRLDAITWWPAEQPTLTTVVQSNLPGTIPGVANETQDIAPAAVQYELATATRRREYLMRGVADADIVNGRFSPRADFAAAYKVWPDYIKNKPLSMRISTFTALGDIDEVTQAGVTLDAALTAPVPAKTLLAVKTQVAGNGPKVATRVRTTSTAAIGATVLPVNWRQGNCEEGTVRTVAYSLTPYLSHTLKVLVRTRKTAGPRTRFRGRR